MSSATIPSIYASGLLDLADELGKRSSILEDCRTLLAGIVANPELPELLDAPGKSDSFSRDLIARCCAGRVEAETLKFLMVIADRGRVRDLRAILQAVVQEGEKRNGIVEVLVDSAVDLDQANRERLEAILRRRYGPAVRPIYRINPDLLASLTIRQGDELVDTTAAYHLERMRRLILGVPADDRLWEGVAASATPQGGTP